MTSVLLNDLIEQRLGCESAAINSLSFKFSKCKWETWVEGIKMMTSNE